MAIPPAWPRSYPPSMGRAVLNGMVAAPRTGVAEPSAVRGHVDTDTPAYEYETRAEALKVPPDR